MHFGCNGLHITTTTTSPVFIADYCFRQPSSFNEIRSRCKPRSSRPLLILRASASAHKLTRTKYNRMKKVTELLSQFLILPFKKQLISELEKHNLDVSGSKPELVDRIWTFVSSKVNASLCKTLIVEKG